MKEIDVAECKQINGGWIPLALAGVRLGYAWYRFRKARNLATWAAKNAAMIGTTYQVAAALDPHHE